MAHRQIEVVCTPVLLTRTVVLGPGHISGQHGHPVARAGRDHLPTVRSAKEFPCVLLVSDESLSGEEQVVVMLPQRHERHVGNEAWRMLLVRSTVS